MRRFGQSAFTLVELMITIVVMVILLALGTVSVTGLQAQARDKEREQDIESIARGLEERYKQGNPIITSTQPAGAAQRGQYPNIYEMLHASGKQITGGGLEDSPTLTPNPMPGGYMTKELPGTTKESLQPPSSNGSLRILCANYGSGEYFTGPCSPASTSDIEAAFEKSGSTYKDNYVYAPALSNGNICTRTGPSYPCVKYELLWISETDKAFPPSSYPQIPGLKIYKSKHT